IPSARGERNASPHAAGIGLRSIASPLPRTCLGARLLEEFGAAALHLRESRFQYASIEFDLHPLGGPQVEFLGTEFRCRQRDRIAPRPAAVVAAPPADLPAEFVAARTGQVEGELLVAAELADLLPGRVLADCL